MKMTSVVGLAFGALFVAGYVSAGESGEAVYQKACASCHDSGKEGAPRLGNMEEWTDRAGWVWSDIQQQHLDAGLLKDATDKGITAEQMEAASAYMASMVGPQ